MGEQKIKPGISQCMIVKNEEDNIERALSWGKGILSEQIVIDTGSTDKTIEIARKMGARVYEFPWIDDFSAVKNYAISKSEYEWIVFLDTDEYFLQEDVEKLAYYLKELQSTTYEGIITRFVDLDEEGKVLTEGSNLRIFRNSSIRYYRRIYEYLRKDCDKEVQTIDLTRKLTIYHTGYRKAEKNSEKNLHIILTEISEHPDDYEMYGYLGNEYCRKGELRKAEESYQKAISLMPEKMKGNYGLTTSGIWQKFLEVLTLIPEKEEEELLAVYRQARTKWPEDGDYDYLMGQYYGTRGDYQAGEKHLKQAFEILEQYGYTAKSCLLSKYILKAYEMLAMCCFNNGNLEECVKITAMMLKENPYLMGTLTVMLLALLKDPGTGGRGKEGARETAVFLGSNFYNLQSLKDRLFILQGALQAGYEDLVEIIKQTFTQEEFVAIDNALQGKLSNQSNQKGEKVIQLVSVKSAVSKSRTEKLRIVLFYCSTESFNFFADQLDREFRARGHETFILDLDNPPAEDLHSYSRFAKFITLGVDVAVCYDAMCIRDQTLVNIWNQLGTLVVDIFMDPPLRFHPSLEHTPEKYFLFCCDREHVEYVKKYFKKEIAHVDFMPHVGKVPKKEDSRIPYKKRKYDILFCGTYYRPEEQMANIKKFSPENMDFYEKALENLKKNSKLSVAQGILFTINEFGWNVPEDTLKSILNISNYVDWAIRMYQRGRVVTALAESGLELYLLGRGWENHSSAELPNVHRINDRIPYGETLAYMADARINLNVMPGFKDGTHDRIFNTLLQRSVPLTDTSLWISENYSDGEDIALYDLDHLDQLPDIARRLLQDEDMAEKIIENGYEKTAKNFTWSHCADWILKVVEKER